MTYFSKQVGWGLALSMIILGSLVLTPRAESRVPEREIVGRVGPSHPLFWRGPFIRAGSSSYRYMFEVAPQIEMLVFSIDVPTRTDFYRVRLHPPRGKTVRMGKGYAYSSQTFIKQPRSGTWTVIVKPDHVSRSTFRMRVGAAELTKSRKSPPPDLRAIPPFGPTFSAPDDGAGSDYDNRPNRSDQTSCATDEVVEDRATRCLRFSAGFENAGLGPLLLHFETSDPEMRVFQSFEGARKAREAGHFDYHPTHQHFHYRDMWRFELFEVTDPASGEMEAIGSGRKSGFCPADQMIAQWRNVRHAARRVGYGNCGVDYVDTIVDYQETPRTGRSTMKLSAGWGDVYGWYRPGNYVDLGDHGDGLYLVQAAIDPDNSLRESNEKNNLGYALVCINGNRARVLERGRGYSSWVRNKSVIRDWWAPARATTDPACS